MFSSKTAHLDHAKQHHAQRLSTLLCFFSLGLSTAAWAPLIPYAQQRLHLNHADFGMLLLSIGLGSMIAMPATGLLIQKVGCRAVISVALLLLLLVLPTFALSSSVLIMSVALFLFGTAAGSLGVAINLQAVIVEKNSAKNMMSQFHGMCSLGGLAGVMTVTALLAIGVSPLLSALAICILLVIISLIAVPNSLSEIENDKKINSAEIQNKPGKLPSPLILLIGLVCFIAFLSEGSAMDWSGIYLVSEYDLKPAFAGLAYTFFAIAMTAGRFAGHYLQKILGEKNIIVYGAICASLGLFTVVMAPHWMVVLFGYSLLGLGCSNIVPVMFSRVGRQNVMPKAAALSCVSTMAYSGSLLGPALVGMTSEMMGLTLVFGMIAALLMLIAFLNHFTQVKIS
ncbi:MFS transporter [Acinetobacter sp. ANC 4862]|uniref:MFS transporter n=1 Tax=Acinetobacter sp. ANC 4862 TaxID=2529849 RepID=UPI00103FCF14|nr:MFS transporter [Acinetobacter sp. ANC 4862]TCH65276.1 MFS transporter [Acinetobacter sp. ANC 4862]